MRPYDYLVEDLNNRQAEVRRQRNVAEQVAETFSEALAKFLGIDNQDRSLMRLRGLKYEGDDPVPADDGEDVALPMETGRWRFVLELQVEALRILCRCTVWPRERNTELHIDGVGHYQVVPAAPGSFMEACRDLYHYMRRQIEAGTFQSK